jgi:DNA-binding Lrp family transcriptional regulator
MMDDLDRAILRAVQDGIPLDPEPFASAARDLEVSESELLRRLVAMEERGEIRRFGASVAHRNAGIAANVMCVWRVPETEVEDFAQEAVEFDAITHCYDRPVPEDWPYNVYAMVHGRTREEVQQVIDALCQRTGQTDYVALVSTREFKKTWTRL